MRKHQGNPSLHYCHAQSRLYFIMHSFPSWQDRDLYVRRGDKTSQNDESGGPETAAQSTGENACSGWHGSLLLVSPDTCH